VGAHITNRRWRGECDIDVTNDAKTADCHDSRLQRDRSIPRISHSQILDIIIEAKHTSVMFKSNISGRVICIEQYVIYFRERENISEYVQ